MLQLKYGVKCGWNQLYIVEKDLEFDISDLVIPSQDTLRQILDWEPDYVPLTEEQFYSKYKDLKNKELIDFLIDECGIDYYLLYDRETYVHTYFAEIFKQEGIYPGIFEINNAELLLIDNDKRNEEQNISLRASEVMSILNITRPTLTSYVKRGLIKIDKIINKQCRYNLKSVYELLDGRKRH